uniref:SET domain-containing protein n=1 Tax=Kalanchoe fedtschenkoi TaxID=63787 RepID=A0A7N1A8C5_KALFE
MASLFAPSPFSAFLTLSKSTHQNPFNNPKSRNYRHPKWKRYVNSLSSPDPDIPPAVQTFWKWLSEEGIITSKTPVRPGIVPEGLGLVALRDIQRQEVVLEVPKRLWINPDAVASSEIGGVCCGLKPWIAVALFLIRERVREDSKWRSYMNILPKVTHSTIFWSEEELEQLQGSQLLSTAIDVKNYVTNEFQKVKEEVINPHKKLFPFLITLDDFMWAFGMLRSRAFSRDRDTNLVIVPLADLVNHSSSVTTEDHAYETKGPAGLFSWDSLFTLRSPLQLKAGEQVVIQYDLKKSNAKLALDYGFIESRRERDAYSLKFEIPKADPLYQEKLDVATANGFDETACFDIFYGPSLPSGMVQYLRLTALAGEDVFLLESMFRDTVWGHLEHPVSLINEEHVCQIVQDSCKTALSGYLTSIDEDERILEGGNLDTRLDIAVRIRAAEKKILQQIAEVFRDRASWLTNLEYYQERRLRNLGLVGEEGEVYCQPK